MQIDVEQELRTYLVEQFDIEFDDDVDDDSDLFQLGLLDSFGYIKMIRHLETTHSVKFTQEEILSDIMPSLNGILSMVSKKLSSLEA